MQLILTVPLQIKYTHEEKFVNVKFGHGYKCSPICAAQFKTLFQMFTKNLYTSFIKGRLDILIVVL